MYISNEDLNKARQVITIIEKEYYKNYTVSDLAKLVGTNKSTLNLAFWEVKGMPVKKYIKQFRVEKAKELLETTRLSVETIAARVGLHRTNLERNFKRQYSKTPKEWRMTNNNVSDHSK